MCGPDAEVLDAAIRGLGDERHRGGGAQIEPGGHAEPAIEDREVAGACRELVAKVGRAEHRIADVYIVHIVADRVDDPRNVEADTAR